MKRRLPKLARWLAGVYLAWSLFVFFGSLFGRSHEWWPLFLYFIIWPASALYHFLSDLCFDWLVPDPKSAPTWVWTLNDYVAGAFYIIVGTMWVWFLGRVLSKVATRIFPFRDDNIVA